MWEFPAHVYFKQKKGGKKKRKKGTKRDFKTRDTANTCATPQMTNCLNSFENIYVGLLDLKNVSI